MVKRQRAAFATVACLLMSGACGRIGFDLDATTGGNSAATGGASGTGGGVAFDASADGAGGVAMSDSEAGPGCGNGRVDPGEECDDAGDSTLCDADCTYAACGDGTVNAAAGEDCDERGGQSATCNAGGCGPNCKLIAPGRPIVDASGCDCYSRLGHRYSFCDPNGTWTASEAVCASMGAHLVRIDDTAEATWVRQTSSWNSHGDDWVGGSATGLDWFWQDGSKFWTGGPAGTPQGGLYSNWDDNYPGAGLGNCAYFAYTGAQRNDVCTSSRHFICEAYHASPATCGNGTVDPGEACDDAGDSAACDADCTLPKCGDGHRNAAFGEACDGGGTDLECPVDCKAPPRIVGNLVALYTFEEGAGTTVQDRSGSGTALDLTIGAPQNATWVSGGGLSITGPAQIHSTAAATKIVTACQTAGSLAVEAWVQTANHSDTNRAIVALSTAPTARNFRMAHEGRSFAMEVRTANSSADGTPAMRTVGLNSGELVHLLYLTSIGPEERFFIDGVEIEGGNATGRIVDFSPWSTTAELWIGDEPGATGADFHGVVRKVAIYCRPQSMLLSDVMTNYFAGP